MVKKLVLDVSSLTRFDYGEQIDFKVYNEDESAFDATGLTYSNMKFYKRHEDRRFFYRDVSRAIHVMGHLAQIIDPIQITWDTIASGLGNFSFSKTARPVISGYVWIELEMTDNSDELSRTKQISTELIRAYVYPKETQS